MKLTIENYNELFFIDGWEVTGKESSDYPDCYVFHIKGCKNFRCFRRWRSLFF